MINVCTDSTGKIIMFSNGYPDPIDNGMRYTLTDEQQIVFEQLNSTTHGGIVFDGSEFSVLPAEEVLTSVELTPQQKLEAAGLTVDELKQLLGLA